jgi:small conductance mechanosensitive channel
MTGMVVLSEVGINIGPLIAGAGVLGLAIGFGSQKLVQDIITGIFIQLENAMNTGDIVTVGGITGVAERLSIRSVGIRDLNGTYHLIPFSSVDTVSNYMREFGYHVGVYGIAYRESIDEAIVHLRNAFDELAANEETKHQLLEPIEISGVTALADSSVNIRVRIKTTPGDQFAIGRAYNRLVKIHFDNAGIEIPFPHTTVYFGQEKDGSAPPANLRLEQLNTTQAEPR